MDILEILKIVGIILLLALAVGGVYYFNLINKFKKLILFENEIKKNPNDALIKQYMIQYKKTFFPKKEQILAGRARFYYSIKENPQVSYEMKKEFRHFFETEGVDLLAGVKAAKSVSEDIADEVE